MLQSDWLRALVHSPYRSVHFADKKEHGNITCTRTVAVHTCYRFLQVRLSFIQFIFNDCELTVNTVDLLVACLVSAPLIESRA